MKLYTTELVDKLEKVCQSYARLNPDVDQRLISRRSKFKNENPDNDTVTDAVAANAYVEQFGLEIFGRAEATMRANKVTKFVALPLPFEDKH